MCFVSNIQSAPKCTNTDGVNVTVSRAADLQRVIDRRASRATNKKGKEGVDGTEWSIVTGAAGFIGSHVAAHCLAIGQNVVIIDDLSGGFVQNLPSEPKGGLLRFENGSISDAAFIARVFEEYGAGDNSIAVIYHLAAYAAVGMVFAL